jgi:hypothetical protein
MSVASARAPKNAAQMLAVPTTRVCEGGGREGEGASIGWEDTQDNEGGGGGGGKK